MPWSERGMEKPMQMPEMSKPMPDPVAELLQELVMRQEAAHDEVQHLKRKLEQATGIARAFDAAVDSIQQQPGEAVPY